MKGSNRYGQFCRQNQFVREILKVLQSFALVEDPRYDKSGI